MSDTNWYRSLKGYKYATTIQRSCIALGLPDFEHEFFRCVGGELIAHPHYAWDGPSGPTFDTPTNMRASLFHDINCQAISEGLLDKKYRKYADELLRTHMLEDQALYADGLLQIAYMLQDEVEEIKEPKKMTGWKRAIYLRWGRFRANGYYNAVRANSRLKGIYQKAA